MEKHRRIFKKDPALVLNFGHKKKSFWYQNENPKDSLLLKQ